VPAVPKPFPNTLHKTQNADLTDRRYLFQAEGKIIYKNLQSLI